MQIPFLKCFEPGYFNTEFWNIEIHFNIYWKIYLQYWKPFSSDQVTEAYDPNPNVTSVSFKVLKMPMLIICIYIIASKSYPSIHRTELHQLYRRKPERPDMLIFEMQLSPCLSWAAQKCSNCYKHKREHSFYHIS